MKRLFSKWNLISFTSSDGFQPLFFKAFWSIIRGDIIAVVKEFFTLGKMIREWKHIYIVLIAKKKDPVMVADYGPISLYDTLYKLLVEVTVTWLNMYYAFHCFY